jgi:hypothetical protein
MAATDRYATVLGDAGSTLGARLLWLRWTLATALGELLGFSLAMVLGALIYLAIGTSLETYGDAAMLGSAMLAGIVEGSILSFAQWLVLRRHIRSLPLKEWWLGTMGGAVAAYMVGTAVGVYSGNLIAFAQLHIVVIVGFGLVFVAALGAILGFAQWLVLRRHLTKASLWITANIVAWTVGLAVGITGPTLIDDWSAIGLVVVMGTTAGLLMGAVVGLITGAALVHILLAEMRRSAPGNDVNG